MNFGTAPKPNMQLSEQPESGTRAALLDTFRGVTKDCPLFCHHCDVDLASEYQCAWDNHAPVQELSALIQMRRGAIVERTWPDGRRDWMCHRCGREVKNRVSKKEARANVPQKGEGKQCNQDHSIRIESATSTRQ